MRAAAPAVFFLPLCVVALPAQQAGPSNKDQAIGTVRFTTSCSGAAQPLVSRAVALLHSFAFSQATADFEAVLAADPRCAVAGWGLALAAWGNPFAAGIKPAPQLARGLAAVQRARAIGAATPREAGYIEAAARLYEHTDSLDQRARLLAYRDAMAELASREPADTEAAIFHALALAISADPRDKTYRSQPEAGAILERLFTRLPDHPGLAHYIIHAYDVPPLAGRALAAAGRYAEIAPALSHALHMPSHTWTREGLWERSIASNVAAGSAARREASTAEELHASDYRVYAYLQLGQDRAARQVLDSLPVVAGRFDPTATGAAAPPSAGYFALAAIPARYALERGAWSEAAALEPQPSPVPFADAMTWFARALGAARSGDTARARSAIAELGRLRDRLAAAGEAYWSEQVDIQRSAAAAWLDYAAGRKEEGLAGARAAAEREDATEKNAITPGPLAPARELLGEMLLAARQPGPALAAFQATLRHEPNRFRALAGAARAASEAGDRKTAATYYGELGKLGAHADRPGRPELVAAARYRP
jgi:Tfp pilus assembly protein PilF